MREQATVGDALKALARFIHIHHEGMRLLLEEDTGHVTLTVFLRGGLSSAPPHPPNRHRGQLAVVALADEQPPVRLDAELLDVGLEQGGQRGWAGYDADLPAGALLEGALIAVAAAVGPLLPDRVEVLSTGSDRREAALSEPGR